MNRQSRRLGILFSILVLACAGRAQAITITGAMTDTGGAQVDSYTITITDPTTFRASTVNAGTTPFLDLMLFLYDSAGNPVVANDDTCNGSCPYDPRATLPWGSLPPLLPPGVYTLAVSVFQNLPYDAANNLLFVPTPTGEGVSGPNPAAGVLDHYAITPNSQYTNEVLTGNYQIDVPEPSTLLLLGSGLLALGLRRRRRP